MIKREIKSSELLKDPYVKWNQFIDLIATEDYKDLTPIQRVAHLTFWLETEVQNGGFLQYFTNRKGSLLNETFEALGVIGALKQKDLLLSLINLYDLLNLKNISDKEEFVEKVLIEYDYKFESQDEELAFIEKINDIDMSYYKIVPSITDLLEVYFNQCEDEFISILTVEPFFKRLFGKKK